MINSRVYPILFCEIMQTILEEVKVEKSQRGEVSIEGKIFKYKITPRDKPCNWADLEILNEKGQSIKIFFNPRRQTLLKEIKRNLKLYKWIKS